MLVSSFSIAGELSTQPVTLQPPKPYQDAFDTRHDELVALLNWAAYLSGYQTNGVNPQLQFRPHAFFVDNACGGNAKCKVVGWYNDQNIVYIDDRLDAVDSMFERSLVVHEFVHYLQHISGKFNSTTCEDFVQREREAYATQREFIMAYGSMPTMNVHQHSCIFDVPQENQLAAQNDL
jgi:hypothetical protein